MSPTCSPPGTCFAFRPQAVFSIKHSCWCRSSGKTDTAPRSQGRAQRHFVALKAPSPRWCSFPLSSVPGSHLQLFRGAVLLPDARPLLTLELCPAGHPHAPSYPREFLSHTSGGWESTRAEPGWPGSGEGALPGGRLLAVSSPGGRDEGALRGLFYKGADPVHEGCTFMV